MDHERQATRQVVRGGFGQIGNAGNALGRAVGIGDTFTDLNGQVIKGGAMGSKPASHHC